MITLNEKVEELAREVLDVCYHTCAPIPIKGDRIEWRLNPKVIAACREYSGILRGCINPCKGCDAIDGVTQKLIDTWKRVLKEAL